MRSICEKAENIQRIKHQIWWYTLHKDSYSPSPEEKNRNILFAKFYIYTTGSQLGAGEPDCSAYEHQCPRITKHSLELALSVFYLPFWSGVLKLFISFICVFSVGNMRHTNCVWWQLWLSQLGGREMLLVSHWQRPGMLLNIHNVHGDLHTTEWSSPNSAEIAKPCFSEIWRDNAFFLVALWKHGCKQPSSFAPIPASRVSKIQEMMIS